MIVTRPTTLIARPADDFINKHVRFNLYCNAIIYCPICLRSSFFASAVNDLPPNRKTGSYISIPGVILAYFAFNVLFFMQV